MMEEGLKQVADLITANTIFCTKEVLTSDEAARIFGNIQKLSLQLTMGKDTPLQTDGQDVLF